MKKMTAMLLAMLLAAIAPLGALAAGSAEAFTNELEQDPPPPFEGLVTEVFEGGFLFEENTMGLMQVNTDDSTVWDGILSLQPIEVGMYVLVNHNGMMTRSIPPQIYGVRVGCYTLNGVASESTGEGVLLTGDPIFGEVFVQMPADMTTVFPGVPMLVYYDGVMTMSLPGKVNARHVVVPRLTGVVSDKDGAGFTLTDEDGNCYRLLTGADLLVSGLVEVEACLTEGPVEVDGEIAAVEAAQPVEAAEAVEAAQPVEDTEAVEAVEPVEDTEAVEAVEPVEDTEAVEAVEPVEDTEAVILETPALPVIEWSNGDTVTVFHQGPIEVEPAAGDEAPVELVALGLLVHR